MQKVRRISNPNRIRRILQGVCDRRLQVFLRRNVNSSTLVRGLAGQIVEAESKLYLRILQISVRGSVHLKLSQTVCVEFTTLASKIAFQCQIVQRHGAELLVELPACLESAERRKNARFATTPEYMALLVPGGWRPSPFDVSTPPVFSHLEYLGGHLSVVDISQGGLSAMTYFPGVLRVFEDRMPIKNSRLYLPMRSAIPVNVQVRWIKKTTSRQNSKLDGTFIRYRLGFSFDDQDEQSSLEINRFIHFLARNVAI